MPARLVHKADFERLLGVRPWARSVHFSVHHLPSSPTRPLAPAQRRAAHAVSTELSTAPAPVCPPPVDDLPTAHWLGYMVPKRNAKRAVTRNLIKRQVRAVFEQHAGGLPAGLWLVRLRQPFAVSEFPSAASQALRGAARQELDGLFAAGSARRAGPAAVASAPAARA